MVDIPDLGIGVGYGQYSATLVIPENVTGSGVTAADLGRNCGLLEAEIDCTNIPTASTTATFQIGRDDGTTMYTVWKSDGSGAFTTGNLPQTGRINIPIRDVVGARWVRMILSSAVAATKSVTVVFRGFDQAVGQ